MTLTVVRQVSFTIDFSHGSGARHATTSGANPERTCEQVADVRVRLVVEQVLEVPKNSSQDRNLQGTVEQIPDDPVLEKAEQLVEVPETVSRNGVQQRTVEQIVDA